MLILPRPNPLYENIQARKVNLVEALTRMGGGGFTGYLGFGSSSSEGYLIFIKGVLTSALLLEGERRKSGFDAISSLFDHFLADEGILNIYRMTPEVAVCTNAILNGTVIVKPEPVRSVDLKAMLSRMSSAGLHGTVMFNAPERSAMIFYKAGTVIGFYHDAAQEIENSPAESQRIAALPDTTVEVRSSQPSEELVKHNLLETINIAKLWQAAVEKNALLAGRSRETDSSSADTAVSGLPEMSEAKLDELVDDLKEVVSAYLGRQGAALFERILGESGGKGILLDTVKTGELLDALDRHVPEIDPEAKTEEMFDLIRSEISGRIAG